VRGDNGLLRGACHRAALCADPLARNDVASTEYDSAISRRAAPELSMTSPPQQEEGAGNAGCLLHPRSRVQMCAKETHTSIQVQSEHPGIPCAMVLRLIPRSPRRRIRLASVADGLKDCLNPVGSTRLRQLDTSNGCQDHTALPYAASRLRLKASPGIGAGRLHAVFAHGPKPALRTRPRARRCRVHRIPPQRS
jgi:hypothetical protein